MERILKEPPKRDGHYAMIAARNLPVMLGAARDIPSEPGLDLEASRYQMFRATERHLFSDTVVPGVHFADLLQHPDEDAAQPAIEEYVTRLVHEASQEKRQESEEYVNGGFGLVLVRPEVLHAIEDVYAFLDIDEVVSRDVQLTANQYVALYSHAFIDRQKRPHVQRRALGYINHDLKAIVIKHRDPRIQNATFMQFGVEKLKGVAGKRDTTTLRGSVVYEALADIVETQNIQARLALDPFGLYDRPDDGNHYDDDVDRYLANLPGIHMPDGSEIVKDFCVISGNVSIREFIGRDV